MMMIMIMIKKMVQGYNIVPPRKKRVGDILNHR